MSLPEIRVKIDALDERLLALLNERADLAHEVGVEKRKQGIEIYAPEREEQVLRKLAEQSRQMSGRLPEKAIRAIYREIMSASLALEKDLKIAYLGPPGTDTHEAARSKFGSSVHYRPLESIAEVFASVSRGESDYGVVPRESSTDGAVHQTLDMFMESDLRICAQVVLEREFHLLAAIPFSEIRRLHAHPQIFGECRHWIARHLPQAELIETLGTAQAAEQAAGDPRGAACGGALAGEIFGLKILAHAIQDAPGRVTRHLVIGPSPAPPTGQDRTALMFSMRDGPGGLTHALEPFAQISMSKIESRPSRRHSGEYFFFVDADGHASEPHLQQALAELEKFCSSVRVLGTYPSGAEAIAQR